MNIEAIETLLVDFVSTSTKIQGAVMVSPQGQPLTHPIGISENSTHIMAGTMLHLADCVSEQCQWRAIDWITIQALEGYLILTQCYQELFLLIQANDAPTGFLQRHIRQYLDKLQTSIRTPNHDATLVQLSYRPTELINCSTSAVATPAAAVHASNGTSILSTNNLIANGSKGITQVTNGTANDSFVNISPVSSLSPIPLHLDEYEIAYCRKELAEEIGPIASLICDRILAQNPHLRLMDFVKALSQQIPDEQKALNFQRRVLSSE